MPVHCANDTPVKVRQWATYPYVSAIREGTVGVRVFIIVDIEFEKRRKTFPRYKLRERCGTCDTPQRFVYEGALAAH